MHALKMLVESFSSGSRIDIPYCGNLRAKSKYLDNFSFSAFARFDVRVGVAIATCMSLYEHKSVNNNKCVVVCVMFYLF